MLKPRASTARRSHTTQRGRSPARSDRSVGVSKAVEVELKLEFEPAAACRLISSPILARGDRKDEAQLSTYFDTPDHRLRANGYSLRIRRSGGHLTQTLKADVPGAGLFSRSEWQQDVSAETPQLDGTHGSLAQSIEAEVIGSLHPQFVTDICRSSGVIAASNSQVTFAIDIGQVMANGRTEQICELELELLDGSASGLFDLARDINAGIPLRLGVLSKAERGYRLIDSRSEAGPGTRGALLMRATSVGDAFRIIAEACIRHYRLNEDMLLEAGSVETVHEARVALRRLRTCISLFKPILQADRRTEHISQDLRRLASALGEARSLDILMIYARDHDRRIVSVARNKAMARARAQLSSLRSRNMFIDLAEWLAIGDWRIRPADRVLLEAPIRPFAADLLQDRMGRLNRHRHVLDRADEKECHRLRIQAKKLRYALEFFGPLFTKQGQRRHCKRMVRATEKLQDSLGQLNDIATSKRRLNDLSPGSSATRFGKGAERRLLRRSQDRLESLLERKTFWRH